MPRKSRALPPSPFRRFNSSPEVIRLVVMMYVRFPLSLRNPHSRLGIRLLHAALTVASRPAVSGVAGKLFGGRSKDVDLSRYDTPASEVPPIPVGGRAPGRLVSLLALAAGIGFATFLAMHVRRDDQGEER